MFFKWPTLKSKSGSAMIAATLSMTAAAIAGVLTLTDAMSANSKTRRSVQMSLDLNSFEIFMKDSLSSGLTCGNVLRNTTTAANTFNPYLGDGLRQPLSLKMPGDGVADWLVGYTGSFSPATLVPDQSRIFQQDVRAVVRDVYLTSLGDVDAINTNYSRDLGGGVIVQERVKLANLVVTIENTPVTNGHSFGASLINKIFRLRITSQRPDAGSDLGGPWTMVSCSQNETGNGSTSYTGWTSAVDDCWTVGPSAVNDAIGCPLGTYATGAANVYSGGAVTYLRCCTIRQ